jgi:hypothetical protein
VTIPGFASHQSELFLQGEVMSARKGFVLLVALSALTFLIACGNNSGTATPISPPSGGFSNNNLNGTYVLAVSGVDVSTGDTYSIAGTLTANGSGGITGGTLDINDLSEFNSPVADVSVASGSSYTVTTDGRAQAQIVVSGISGFPTLTFYFALSSSSGGAVTEADNFGTGTGTIDAQTSNVTPTGPYAFSFSGGVGVSDTTLATVGNFTVGSGGAISSGLEDFNDNAAAVFTGQALTGTVAVSSSGPATTLSTALYPSLVFDVFPIDSSHLKFIEMDSTATMLGDAFSQSSSVMPTGTLPFTLNGAAVGGAPFVAGGFFVTDGNGNLTSSSSEDFNSDGTLSPSGSVSFTGTYAADGTGRYTLGNFTSFTGGSAYAAYPSSGGVLLLEIDTDGITTGAAYGPQSSSATFAASEGYAFNFAGVFLGSAEESAADVFDSGEFVTAGSGGTLSSGAVDEAFIGSEGVGAAYGVPLSEGTFTAPSGGRGNVTAAAATGNNGTLNGGFSLTYYVVDGTTFPFIETDSGQVSAGIFVLQSASSSSSAVAKPRALFVPHALVRQGAKHKEK